MGTACPPCQRSPSSVTAPQLLPCNCLWYEVTVVGSNLANTLGVDKTGDCIKLITLFNEVQTLLKSLESDLVKSVVFKPGCQDIFISSFSGSRRLWVKTMRATNYSTMKPSYSLMISLMSSCFMCKKPAIPSNSSGCPPCQTILPRHMVKFFCPLYFRCSWLEEWLQQVSGVTMIHKWCTFPPDPRIHPGLQFLQAEG